MRKSKRSPDWKICRDACQSPATVMSASVTFPQHRGDGPRCASARTALGPAQQAGLFENQSWRQQGPPVRQPGASPAGTAKKAIPGEQVTVGFRRDGGIARRRQVP
jgi:hypothetical protein